MRKTLYILSLLLIFSLVLAACGPAATEEPVVEEPVAEEPVAEEPMEEEPMEETAEEPVAEEPMGEMMGAPEFKNADTYVNVTIGEPETLDPSWTYETAGSAVQTNIYEGLVWFERERNDVFAPLLATDWSVNDAGNVWVFNIREGVTFHEGGTLEPHDITYSIQRALLQDRIDGPHWMTHEAFFGTFSMQENVGDGETPIAEASAEDLVAACELVKSAVVADDEAGTVTFNLDRPTPWFLALLSNIFIGATYDQEWMAENGDWDGSCDTWQEFNDPAAEDTILFDAANGTGPYKLDHWTPGEEIVMVRNENYWRAEGDPIWEGGPSGIASIERIVRLSVDEFSTRLAMYQAGDADFIYVDPQFYSQVESDYGTVCDAENNCTQGEGWMQVFHQLPTAAMTPAQFNWQINSEGGNVFQGSGELDGNGIPDDFFADEHIRKAFSWCFDYETMVAEALAGEGIQAQGPIIAGMLGYREDGFVYSYDPDKCVEEFQSSESGVWDTGFYMQIAYNTGNDTRRLAAEILKAGIEGVNENFQIQVVGMPWPVLLNARRAQKLPIYVGGWLEDFHDPHNWVHPFLHSQGAYGRVVNITEPAASEYDALIEEAASLTTADERRPIYEELQLRSQTDAVMIWLYQPLGRNHLSPYVHGYYYNAAYSSSTLSYVYALSKVAP